jgi:hypothetical protein
MHGNEQRFVEPPAKEHAKRSALDSGVLMFATEDLGIDLVLPNLSVSSIVSMPTNLSRLSLRQTT